MHRLNPPEGGRYRGMAHAVSSMLRTEGVGSFYRGIGAVAIGAGPAHALYFGSYEYIRDWAGGNQDGHRPLATGLPDHNHSYLQLTGLGAICATVAHDGFLVPCEGLFRIIFD